MMAEPAIVCHGGAGHGAKDQPAVDVATSHGWDVLHQGGSALDAAIAAVVIMENDPSLNAGTGGRIRADGSVQLDAAVMTSDGRFGAVTCIEHTKNPVLVAAKLLDEQINMLAGRGAREFADSLNVPRDEVLGSPKPTGNDTVGAIVRDQSGLIVVASSTGGCTGRPAGRIGDTPLIGAGLWCDESVGVSATGIGEAITLKMSCIRIADRISSGGELSDTLQWAVEKFDSDVEVGFIGLAPQGEGVGLANTNMPWASKS
ncbi:MAG: isoaspartyl peptidase/L-asparaginase [Candidatus Thalassarchaeaceae archaeon]|nr:isoaspartyl peptidase/L-asparaginase [Candidatus Thalassarchaeaceae archaeon]